MDDLKDKVAVITGAASGIGRAMADAFAQQGMRLVLADITEDALNTAVEELRRAGVDCLSSVVDVSKAEQVEALAELAFDTYGSVNVLCNNAGVSTIGRQWEQTHDDWEWVLSVDLWGPINGIRSFVPRMLAAGQPGHIVNTASLGGLMLAPLVGPYSAAKHAVVGISRGLRAELGGTGIDVSVICPAEVRTGMVTGIRERVAATKDNVPDEIAGILDVLESSLRTSLEPAAVGELVVNAIQTNTFWIMPNVANYLPLLEADFKEMAASIEAGPKAAHLVGDYWPQNTES